MRRDLSDARRVVGSVAHEQTAWVGGLDSQAKIWCLPTALPSLIHRFRSSFASLYGRVSPSVVCVSPWAYSTRIVHLLGLSLSTSPHGISFPRREVISASIYVL